jgi:hypothetical protein
MSNAPLMVSNTNGRGPGSLRQAIIDANHNGGDNTIDFTARFNTPQTISLGGIELFIKDRGLLTINGPAAGVTVVGGGGRVFELAGYASAVISNFTITGCYEKNNGGGVLNKGNLTLNSCKITNDTAHLSGRAYGGGIYNSGTVTLNNCVFRNDTVDGTGLYGCGGGLYNSGTANLTNCTITNNTAKGGIVFGGYGGGVYTNQNISLVSTTVKGNTAKHGPNIYYGTGIEKRS